MPNSRTPKIPSYRLHKPSGLAVVRLNGQDIYLGRHGSPRSRSRYEQAVAQWLASHRQMSASGSRGNPSTSPPTVNELFLAYWNFAQGYYVKNGKPTGEQANLRDALRPLVDFFGTSEIGEFGPAALKAVRQRMIERRLCRRVINARVNRIRRMFKWAVENQLVQAGVLHALQAVAPLKRGRCEARETDPVKPVPQGSIDAVLEYLPSQIAAMIRLQLLTAMRPGEVVLMRGCDIDTTGKLWTYRPSCHKTEHHGKDRVVYLGPAAQRIIKDHFKSNLNAFLFSPRDAMKETLRSLSHAPANTVREAQIAAPAVRPLHDSELRRSYHIRLQCGIPSAPRSGEAENGIPPRMAATFGRPTENGSKTVAP